VVPIFLIYFLVYYAIYLKETQADMWLSGETSSS